MRLPSVIALYLASFALADDVVEGQDSQLAEAELKPQVRTPRMNYTGNLDADVLELAISRGWMHNCSLDRFPISRNAELYAIRYIFPVHFVFGTIGNVLNLCVLLTMNNEMSVANVLFAGVAFADLGLLLAMSSSLIGAWPVFYTKSVWRWIFYHTHTLILWAENTFLCISSWMVSAVSIERFLSIRDPIRIHRQTSSKWRVYLIVVVIIVGSMMLNSYHLFEYHYGFAYICDGTLLIGLHDTIVNPVYKMPHWFVLYITGSKLLQIIFAVFVPLTLITICNICIIYMLKKSRIFVAVSTNQENHERSIVYRSTSTEEARVRRDRKISITVATIISCFLVTHMPSSFPFVMELLHLSWPKWMKAYGQAILTYWLLCGKVMNFVLFCLTSATFRKQLVEFYKNKRDRFRKRLGLTGQKKYSVISNGQSVRLTSLQKRRENTDTVNSEYDLDDSLKEEPGSAQKMRNRQTFSF